jgi:hypothetical protein
MLRTELLHLKLVKGLDQWSPEQLLERFSTRFDEATSFGFVRTESHEQIISSTMVYRYIIARRQFDPVTNTIVSQPQAVFDYVPFRIDYDVGLLEAALGGGRLAKLISALGKLFDFGITIEDLHVNLKVFVRELDQRNRAHSITKIAITNFRPEAGLSGRFVAYVYEQRIARALIREYARDVTGIDIELTVEESPMIWRLSSSGSIAVRAEEEMLEKGLSILRQVVLRCKDA